MAETEAIADYHETLDKILRAELLDAARVEELQAAIAPLKERLAELEEARAERRERLASLLDAHGVTSDARPMGKVTLARTPPRVEIADAEALPAHFIRINPEPDKAAIRKALAAGEVVPGVRLSNGSITVRITQ